MPTVTVTNAKAEDVVRRAIFLAYQACGGPLGMGILQAIDRATEEDVWNRAYGVGDYPGGREIRHMKEKEVYGDYVFGRMMKWGCTWDDTHIFLSGREFKHDYQGFSHTYPDEKALISAAAKELRAVVVFGA